MAKGGDGAAAPRTARLKVDGNERTSADSRVYDYGFAQTVDGTASFSIQRGRLKEMPERSLIGVDGKWYDVTAFKKYHPGGDIIEEYVGMDATQIFHAWHPPSVLAKRRPVGTYDLAAVAPHTQDPFEIDMRALHDRFEREGWFHCDKWWLAQKTAIIFALLIAAQICAASSNPYVRYGLGVFFMTGFWIQSGFMMHDAMHSQHFDTHKLNQLAGVFWGSICFGIPGRWWRDEHYEHHSFTHTTLKDQGVSDPQFDEDIWVTGKRIYPFRTSPVQRFFISIQDYSWICLIMIAGRFAIMIDSYKDERRLKEWAAIAVHWTVTCLPIYIYFDTTLRFVLWYLAAGFLEGILHVQLVISHLASPVEDKEAVKNSGWFRWQITSTYNITNPRWLDWFHGGLNFHMVHHSYPRMPRTRYVEAQKLIDQLCDKHGVRMYKASFTELVHICSENFGKQKKGYLEFLNDVDFRH